VIAMAKDIKKTKKKLEEKKPQVKNKTNGSCGCGCVPPVKTK